jgi:hypothetical protein
MLRGGNSRPVSLGKDGAGEEALVTGLDGEDRSSNGAVKRVSDVLVGTDVGGDTNVLEEGREGDEGLHVGEGEGVLAGGNGVVTEGSGKKLDVRALVLGDLRDTSSDPVGVAGGLEVGSGELGKSLGVVGGLEVLEGEGVLKNLKVGGLGRSGLSGNGGSDREASSDEGGESEQLHCDEWFGFWVVECVEWCCERIVVVGIENAADVPSICMRRWSRNLHLQPS